VKGTRSSMIAVKRLVLDVLKPHAPNSLEFGKALAQQGGYRVRLTVVEIDEKTETVQVVIEGENVDFERIQAAIAELGASLHSIDEVEVVGESEPAT
jgi:hypothetical protein